MDRARHYGGAMQGVRSVLIVEDEPLIAMMLEDFIVELGHRVAGTVDCVEDALARIGDGDIDVVILDVHLRGGEPCWPVADALAARGLPYVFSTGGHAADAPAAHREAPSLAKPFTMAGVEAALSELG